MSQAKRTPPEGYLPVGEVVKPQGIRGEVRVLPTTDAPQVWQGIRQVGLFDRAGNWLTPAVTACRIHQDMVIAKLEGLEDRNGAEALRGLILYAHREVLAPLLEGRYFLVDLIGCGVEDENGRSLGRVIEVMQPGANDVYVVQDGRQEILLPAIASLVREIRVEEKRIVVDSQVLSEVAVYED